LQYGSRKLQVPNWLAFFYRRQRLLLAPQALGNPGPSRDRKRRAGEWTMSTTKSVSDRAQATACRRSGRERIRVQPHPWW